MVKPMSDLKLGKRLAPPRFLMFAGLMVAGSLAHRFIVRPDGWTESIVSGFDVAAAVFVLSLIPLLHEHGADAIRRHADTNDANRVLVLIVTTALTLVILAAISGELAGARSGDPGSTARLIGTLLAVWLFANSVFALHYAHDYYTSAPDGGGDSGGIEFPGGLAEPAYADFAYFSFTIGMTFQTSDCAITAPRIRYVALLHSFAAFVFNLGVIAFTLSALGSA